MVAAPHVCLERPDARAIPVRHLTVHSRDTIQPGFAVGRAPANTPRRTYRYPPAAHHRLGAGPGTNIKLAAARCVCAYRVDGSRAAAP